MRKVDPSVSLKLCCLSAIGLSFSSTGAGFYKPAQMNSKSPNVVLIVADDLGYGDFGCFGADKIPTPAIDKLAREGMIFTNAYASSSLSSPSRYSIMTGRYAWRTRLKYAVLTNFDKPLIEKERTTLASLFKRNGYHTACIGKWHLGFDWSLKANAPANPDSTVFGSWDNNAQMFIDYSKPVKNGPIERGFDYFFGMAGSNNMRPLAYIENDRVTQAPSEKLKPYDHGVDGIIAPNFDLKTIDQILTFKAVDVIHDHFKTSGSQPLFLYFPTSAIHRPCLPTFTKGKSKAGLRGDIVVEFDWMVNEIIKALKEDNAYDNTVFIITSDNGPMPGDPVQWLEIYKKNQAEYENYDQPYFRNFTSPQLVNENGNPIWKHGWITYDHQSAGNHLGFKSDAWDGGIRIPFIIRWPAKIKAGSINKNMICLSDLMATFSAMLGDRKNEGEDSYSFYNNLLDVKDPQVRKSLTITGGASGAFIEITNDWKYIEAAKPGRWPETYYPHGPSNLEPQLYFLKEDQQEQKNLYGNNPSKVTELLQIIEKVKVNSHSEAN